MYIHNFIQWKLKTIITNSVLLLGVNKDIQKLPSLFDAEQIFRCKDYYSQGLIRLTYKKRKSAHVLKYGFCKYWNKLV